MSRPEKASHNITSSQSKSGTSPAEPRPSSTPLLPATTPPAMYGTTSTTPAQRPSFPRAQTTTTSTPAATATASPTLSRPLPTRAQTSTPRPIHQRTVTTSNQQAPTTRPSLLKRISTGIDSALELSTSASHTHRNRPPPPSHWTHHAHRPSLLATWDSIHEAALTSTSSSTKSKYTRSVLGQLAAVQQSLVIQFPELAEGEVKLEREWMEYVLGVALRHPFCAEGKMGRWEVLSGAGRVGGMRAWGPWHEDGRLRNIAAYDEMFDLALELIADEVAMEMKLGCERHWS